ncbi:hypothetical protein V8C44DRAFT_349932 [Trichoderma aethiopicum]
MPIWTRGNYVPETRPFDPPYFFRISQCQEWGKNTREMLGDELLWRTYWKRFNTVEIPILPQDEFFDTALSIAKLAGGRRKEFERIFEERNKEKWTEVKRLLGKTHYHAECHKEAFPCEDARKKLIRVCETGCLTHFLDILKGNAYGYEADVVRDEPPENAPKGYDEETQVPEDYFDEDGMPRSQRFNYDPDICFYEEPSTKDWREPLMADNVFYIGSYTLEYAPPEKDDGGRRTLNPVIGNTSPTSPVLSDSASTPKRGDGETPAQTKREGKRKRLARKSVRFDDVVDVESHQHQQQLGPDDDSQDDDRAHKRARLDATSPDASSLSQPATNESVSKKRTRQDDDSNDRQKRQKLETPTSPAPAPHVSSPIPTATTKREPRRRTRNNKGDDHGRTHQGLENPLACPPTPSASSTTATGSTTSRKRSREGDDDDNGFKRQNIEDPAAHTPPSVGSSSTQQTTGERPNEQKADARKTRKRRESSTRPSRQKPSPAPRSLNTRSSRKGGSSTFYQLDQSGKPRSV